MPRAKGSAGRKAPRERALAAQKRRLEERGVRYCLAAYVDVHGIAKTKSVPIAHFERMMRGSELFTGAALDGLGQAPNDDELAVHAGSKCRDQLPWRPEVAWAPGKLRYHEQPYPMCSRNVLRAPGRTRRASMGSKFNLGIECEIYIVRRDERITLAPDNPRDTLAKAAYDVTRPPRNMALLNEVDRRR